MSGPKNQVYVNAGVSVSSNSLDTAQKVMCENEGITRHVYENKKGRRTDLDQILREPVMFKKNQPVIDAIPTCYG